MKSIFLSLCMLTLVCTGVIPEDKLSTAELVNYKIYSDDQNSSYLPYEGKYSFNTFWEKPAGTKTPVHLALKDSLLIAWCISSMEIRQKSDGDILWQTELIPMVSFDLKDYGIVTQNEAGFYIVIDFDKKIEEKISLPFLSELTRLYFSEKEGKEMRYCYLLLPEPTTTPEDEYRPPEFSYSRFLPDEREFVWEFVRPGTLKAVLRTTDKNNIHIVCENRIYSFDRNTSSDDQVKVLETDTVLAASVDNSGNILLYAKDKEGYGLQCLAPGGKMLWKIKLDYMPSLQPPSYHPEGIVYSISGNNLLCISNGKINWSYNLPAHPGNAFLTVLKDKSVLVSSEQTLLHISGSGKLLQQKFFLSPLTCRPLADKEGNIYVCNKQFIYCLK